MKASVETQLKDIFGNWVTFDEHERILYSHDVASLPGAVEMLVGKVADAVVMPENTNQIQRLVKIAKDNNLRLTPRGAGTTGYGGTLPIKKGIVVSFSRMRQVVKVDASNKLVTVEAGVVWAQLDKLLREQGFALRCYPSSGPSATVGGWIAEGGSGIGSYHGGFVEDNIVGIKVVTPDGSLRAYNGKQMALFNRAEGITGFIVEATIKIDKAEDDKMILASFSTFEQLSAALQDLSKLKLPLWHVNFTTAQYNRSKAEGLAIQAANNGGHSHDGAAHSEPGVAEVSKDLLFVVYRSEVAKQVEDPLKALINKHKGKFMSAKAAQHEWDERFFPMRLKSLGPSLIPSEAIIPVASVAQVIAQAEKALPGINIEGSMVGTNEFTLLCFLTGDERTAAFTLGFAKSLKLLEIAEKNGGRPYSAGLYFADRAENILGKDRVNKIRKFKKEFDPKNLFNPGKILPEGDNPLVIRTAMQVAGGTQPIINILEGFFSRNPQMRGKLPTALAVAAFSCAQCGYCNEVCTLSEGFTWESASPRGKWYLLRKYLKGEIDLNQNDVDMFLMCTTCKKCDTVCQVNLPIMGLWDQIRPVLTMEKGYGTYPAFEMMGASIESDLNIWAGRKVERDDWIPKDVVIQDKAEIGYWAGCTAAYVETEVAENAVRILQEGGVSFTNLGKDEGCCGVPMLVAGKPDTFEIVFRNNIEHLKKRGVKELVISCPGCYMAWTHYYPMFAKQLGVEMDFKFVHITEFTERLINEGKLKFKKPINKKLTWHDSCHIGRHSGIYDPPREVLKAIPGVVYEDTAHNREEGRCCGSVLTRIGKPDVANKLACNKLQEAVDINADAVVATCPCCEVQLRVGGAKGGVHIPVIDFSSIVAEALGFESKDTTEHMFYMWGVFEKAIEIMNSEGIIAMMSDMMPEIMEAMPEAMKPMLKIMSALPSPIQGVPLSAMEKMIPMMMPAMFPGMMPKLMPTVLKMMKQAIPNMPIQMEEKLPEMLPKVMAKIMPGLMAEVAPALAPKMTAYLAKKKAPVA